MKIEKRIKELKIDIIDMAAPLGVYVPAMQYGDLITTSGQLPFRDQRILFPGRVGKEVQVENAQRAARAAAINCLMAVRSVCKDLDKIRRIVRINGFVCSALAFNQQPSVLNAASELLIDIFGKEVGQHTRCAVGVFELPMRSCIEIDMTVQVDS
jgi:enamine deaminase RidA (YjgF/YER057c/UK114 family)